MDFNVSLRRETSKLKMPSALNERRKENVKYDTF